MSTNTTVPERHPMKVCITFHNDIFTPWPATSIIHPVELLLEAGHEISVLSWDKGRSVQIKESTLPVKREQVRVPVRNFASFYTFSRKLSDRLVDESPGLIFAFDLEVLRGSANAARRLGVPLLFFAREDWPSMVRGSGTISGIMRSIAFARLEKSICTNAVEHAYSVNPERGEKYVGWSVPYTTVYTTKALSELPELPPRNSGFTLALAGSMLEMQALPRILEAMKGVDCNLRLIGGDEKNIPGVRKIVDNSGLSGRVTFTGHLPSLSDYFSEIGRCSVGLTFPLNTDMNKYLGISVKMWDYMAMGLPQIVSNMPAMASIMKGNGSQSIGLTADPQSTEEIAKAISYYASHREEAEAAGMLARNLFIEKYCWDRQKEILRQSHWVFRGNRS